MTTIRLSANDYAFFWSFPEMVADESGMFARQGLEIQWLDVTPKDVVDKSGMYWDLMEAGRLDVYHAAEWVCISRVSGGGRGRIVAKSPVGESTLNSTFVIYADRKSGLREPQDLAGVRIAVEKGTGSYYSTVQDLEWLIPRAEINLKQVGGPHLRLLALHRGEVEAASLMGPYVDLAEELGLVKVLESRRRNPTLIVANKDLQKEVLRSFLEAVNRAIMSINEDPARHMSSYFRRFERVLDRLPHPVGEQGMKLRDTIHVPRWLEWQPYTQDEFRDTYEWMLKRSMIDKEGSYEVMVDTKAFD
ncbi:MAG: ABC transporter substrate-binding protein, partial [Candidatus Geothermarchaeales archaeon]